MLMPADIAVAATVEDVSSPVECGAVKVPKAEMGEFRVDSHCALCE